MKMTVVLYMPQASLLVCPLYSQCCCVWELNSYHCVFFVLGKLVENQQRQSVNTLQSFSPGQHNAAVHTISASHSC